ncbi:MAG: YHS domain-containing protein, partial [Cyanobacteria bacterium]|nr:YHS domain-containing protein [Cyanobacteriota bacterium]
MTTCHGSSVELPQTQEDPVCHMTVSIETAKYKTNVGVITHYFCSEHCLRKFEASPETFLQASAQTIGVGCCKPKAPPAVPSQSMADHAELDFTCPMHPEIVQKGAGACPKCGMDLEPVDVTLDRNSKIELRAMYQKLIVGAVLTLPLLFIAMGDMVGIRLMAQAPDKIAKYIQFALASPVVLFVGWDFFKRGVDSVRNRSLNMFSLIALGVGIAYVYSTFVTLFPTVFPSRSAHVGTPVYFEAAAVIVT